MKCVASSKSCSAHRVPCSSLETERASLARRGNSTSFVSCSIFPRSPPGARPIWFPRMCQPSSGVPATSLRVEQTSRCRTATFCSSLELGSTWRSPVMRRRTWRARPTRLLWTSTPLSYRSSTHICNSQSSRTAAPSLTNCSPNSRRSSNLSTTAAGRTGTSVPPTGRLVTTSSPTSTASPRVWFRSSISPRSSAPRHRDLPARLSHA